MKATSLNEDLANEVLRIKDNLIMYPDERQKKTRHLTVKIGETPADRPATVTEWLNEVIIGRGTSTTYIPTFPKKEEEKPTREKLTTEHKALLREMSYKPRTDTSNNIVSLAA